MRCIVSLNIRSGVEPALPAYAGYLDQLDPDTVLLAEWR